MTEPSKLLPDSGFGRRDLYDDEHEMFREGFRRFVEKEVLNDYEQWERDGIVPRNMFVRAGELGFLGMNVDEAFGGSGVQDFRYSAIIGEETQRAGIAGFGVGLTNHNDVCVPYLVDYAIGDTRERWLRGAVSGELITAIAMTEPGTGSDLAAIATRGRRSSGDDGWIVNGTKTFITCGFNADLVITAVRTDLNKRHDGLTLMVVERGMAGFGVGSKIDKIGLHSQDTAELFFEDVFVPDTHVLGSPGDGFRLLTSNLPQERLTIAIAAQAAARGALSEVLEYVEQRHAFGRSLSEHQATRFALAEMCADVEVGQAYIDHCTRLLTAGRLTAERAAVAKLWATEMQGRVVDRCLQLHGGYGYTTDYRIGNRYVDARVTRIYGGTSEIMKEIIGRSLRSA